MNIFKIESNSFAFDNYISNLSFNDFINEKFNNKMKSNVFLCPFDGLTQKNSKEIVKNSSCNNCGLCNLKYNDIKNIEMFNFDKLLSSLPHVAITLKYIFPEALIATEVKTDGNNRNKRIDIILKKDNTIYLSKVINNNQKINFYYRSFENTLNNLKYLYPSYNYKILFIVSNDTISLCKELKQYNYTTLNTLIKEVLIDGNSN